MANIAGETWSEWLVKTYDIKQMWALQPTYVISHTVFLLAGLVTLIHAFRKGGRWPYLWLATILHGFVTDNFWHIVVPEYDNFWHSQTPVMLMGMRLPLHIIFLYPAFIYHAIYAVSRLNLPKYAQPFAVGLCTVLIDIPYDIVAVKFVHWTWHDTDPNVYDRHYWVPWNSYYFHASFAASFYFFFTISRSWFAPKVPQWEAAGKGAEFKSVIIAALLGMPGGVLQFIPVYHPLHDNSKVHTEVTFFFLFAVYSMIVLSGLVAEKEKIAKKLTAIDYVLLLQLAIHYLIYYCFVIFFDPEKEVSIGLHEPVGPCNEVATLLTPFGQELKKRKYFCTTDYDEKYFDFHCVGNKLPPNGANWYTICGTPFPNRTEYILVLTTILVVASTVYSLLYFKTVARQETPTKKLKKK